MGRWREWALLLGVGARSVSAGTCASDPAEDFAECLRKTAKNVDEAIGLLPTSQDGADVCESMTFLRRSSSPQGEDIRPSAPGQGPRFGLICGNGNVYLRLTTDPEGPHFRSAEILVRNGRGLRPFRIASRDGGGLLVEENPMAQHGGALAGKRCTDCHGIPTLLLFPNYNRWPSMVGDDDDQIPSDQVEALKAALRSFRERKEPRFEPALRRMRATDNELFPWRFPFTLDVRTRPNAQFSAQALSLNGLILGESVTQSPRFADLAVTSALVFNPMCRPPSELLVRLRRVAELLGVPDVVKSARGGDYHPRAQPLLLGQILGIHDFKADAQEPTRRESASFDYVGGGTTGMLQRMMGPILEKAAARLPKGIDVPEPRLNFSDYEDEEGVVASGGGDLYLKEGWRVADLLGKQVSSRDLTKLCESDAGAAIAEAAVNELGRAIKKLEAAQPPIARRRSDEGTLGNAAGRSRGVHLSRAVETMRVHCAHCHASEVQTSWLRTDDGQEWLREAVLQVKRLKMPPLGEDNPRREELGPADRDRLLENLRNVLHR